MKWIVYNQIPHLKHYVYFYLKQTENYKHLNYRDSEDFPFFEPDRALLITNKLDEKTKRFIEDSKKNNVFLTLITEELKDLEFSLSFSVREKDNFLNNNSDKFNFNVSNMHLSMPKILKWIRKKKTGNFKFFDNEKYKINKDEKDNYVIPSSGTDLEEKIVDIKTPKKINIYTATYYRFEKTKKSIMSIIELAEDSIHDIKIYIGDNNTKIEEMKEWLETINKNYEDVEVYFSEKNIGKANIINYLYKNYDNNVDYVFSIDSDMYTSEEFKYNTFDKMVEILETCSNVGLVSSNQSELSQHWYGRGVEVKEDRGFKLGFSNDGVGVAGGCIVLRKSDWEKIGGYKENHDIYTGDDSILTYNVYRKLGMIPVIAHDYFMVHPKGEQDEMEYTKWKMASWQRDNVKFIKDNYKGTNEKGFFD
jgi:GT2 family glycosyltransferase